MFPLVLATNLKAAENAFKEGTSYTVINGLEPYEKPTVTELFTIYCGGCYQWEYRGPLDKLKTWLQQNHYDFKQAHMTFMGNYAEQATIALAITSGTPRYDAVKKALFNHIHSERKGDWANDQKFFESLKAGGLSEKEFQAQKNSLPVAKTRMDWMRYAKYIQAVPSFIVNNRYLINMSSLKSPDQLEALITYLNKLPVNGKP